MDDLHAPPPVEESVLQEVRDLQGEDDPDFLAELVTAYLRDSRARLRDLRDSVARGDLSSAASVAHALKGSSLNIGALRLGSLCQEAESEARRGAWCDSAIPRLAAEFGRVEAHLAPYGRTA